MLAFSGGSVSKLHFANPVLSLVSKLPKQPDFLALKRLLLASQEVSISPDVGLCANGAWWIIAFISGTKRLSFKIQANGIEQEVGVPGEEASCLR
jgi:hypothetical protein